MKCIPISDKIIYNRAGAPFFRINEIIFDNKFDFSRFFVEKWRNLEENKTVFHLKTRNGQMIFVQKNRIIFSVFPDGICLFVFNLV